MNVRGKENTTIDDPDLFMAMDDLELVSHGIVEGALSGNHRSPFIGFSVEFDSHREYQTGDDLRHVNWDLWARTDDLYVKQYRSDTNLNLYIFMDISGSMLCDNGPNLKWRYAARAAAALSFLALSGRDAAGVYLLKDRIEQYTPPRVRPGQFHEILATLQNARPSGKAEISNAMDEALEVCKRKGIVVFISDMFDNQDAILSGLNNFRYLGHEVIIFQILDPFEASLPEKGLYEFTDLESEEKLKVDVATIRDDYNRAFTEWQNGFKHRCENHGIEWIPCLTSDPIRGILIDYILTRTRMF